MQQIFHITSQQQWQRAEQAGIYEAESLATEGFMHCSTAMQIAWVANAFYQGQPDLVLLKIDLEKVQPEVRFEQVEGVPVENAFPHIYGGLNLDAVVEVIEFLPTEDGWFVLPQGI